MLEEPIGVYHIDQASNQVIADAKRRSGLEPIIKWPGGKGKELKYIIPNLPDNFTNYFEPFVGGGSVYTSITADKYYINDKSSDLIELYHSLKQNKNTLFYQVSEKLIDIWDELQKISQSNYSFFKKVYNAHINGTVTNEKLDQRISQLIETNMAVFIQISSFLANLPSERFLEELKKNLSRKIRRMKALCIEKGRLPDIDIANNIETAFKSAFYMYLRHIYNHSRQLKIRKGIKSSLFFFIRNYAYSGMFRYNSKGEFNVPYGGIAYNRKSLRQKLEYYKCSELQRLIAKTEISCMDFEVFFQKASITDSDFVFLDPPYDSEFSSYDNNDFNRQDQARLANYLINNCPAKWLMIIKNTEFIFSLYNRAGINISSFDKTYQVSFMNRNNKNTEHLLITNY